MLEFNLLCLFRLLIVDKIKRGCERRENEKRDFCDNCGYAYGC